MKSPLFEVTQKSYNTQKGEGVLGIEIVLDELKTALHHGPHFVQLQTSPGR